MPKNTRTAKPSRTPGQNAKPSSRKKIGRRLERIARQIKDSDEFVDHVAGLCGRYRHEHALRESAAQAAVRQSTRTFQRHAGALAVWLQQAHDGAMTAIEREALDRIGALLHGSPGAARSQSAPVLNWLTRASQAAEESIVKMARRQNDVAGGAARVVAEGLRATFEHHKLKVTLSAVGSDRPANAVGLLCAIAQDAGDDSLDADTAKAAVRDAGRAQHPAAAIREKTDR